MKGPLKVAVGGLALLGLGYAFMPKKKRARKKLVRTIAFENDGESFTTLRKGDRIVVTYDAAQPWTYVGIPVDAVDLVDVPKEGTVEFVVARTMQTGGIAQVYVQALDQNGDMLAEHKITVQGP